MEYCNGMCRYRHERRMRTARRMREWAEAAERRLRAHPGDVAAQARVVRLRARAAALEATPAGAAKAPDEWWPKVGDPDMVWPQVEDEVK
jgi:hypothetical protein